MKGRLNHPVNIGARFAKTFRAPDSPLTRAGHTHTVRPPFQTMQKLDFSEAVEQVVTNDPRYHKDAYYFLRDALDHTVKLRKRALGEGGHVSGQQLCEGIRQLAVKQYGPMVPTVFDYWGVKKTDDFGEMVWNLCELGVFGRTEKDNKKDFHSVYDFHEAFKAPYEPGKAAPAEAPASSTREDVPF